MKVLDTLLKIFGKVGFWVVVVLMGAMSVLAFSAVIFRFVLHNPLTWSEEAARYMMVWVTFVGAGVAMEKGKHIGATLIVNKLPVELRKWCIVLSEVILVVFLGMLIYQGTNFLLILRLQTSPAMGLPMVMPYFAIPFGCTYMFLHVLKMVFSKHLVLLSTDNVESKDIGEEKER
ncbi:MAG: TRAP transporter small permease [Synergistetes bacterium]|nr:TRAP transporter small permease [Synergistota bacterium]